MQYNNECGDPISLNGTPTAAKACRQRRRPRLDIQPRSWDWEQRASLRRLPGTDFGGFLSDARCTATFACVQVKEIHDEIVWVDRLDVELVERRLRKSFMLNVMIASAPLWMAAATTGRSSGSGKTTDAIRCSYPATSGSRTF